MSAGLIPAVKPLGRKSYGSIGHLPGSRLGPGDHHVNEGQARCMLEVAPRHDRIIVQEKLDGTNVGVCLVDGKVWPIGRAGWDAWSSPREQHRMFAAWVEDNEDRFRAVLLEGERVCGEWLALAHGTRYVLPHEPFVVFDLFTQDDDRLQYDPFLSRLAGRFAVPHVFHDGGALPLSVVEGLSSHHGAIDPMEGVVYRWERQREGRVLMLAKWVRPGKVDGLYLDDKGTRETPELWNWRPDAAAWPRGRR